MLPLLCFHAAAANDSRTLALQVRTFVAEAGAGAAGSGPKSALQTVV